MNLRQLANLTDLFLGEGRDSEETLVLTEDRELRRLLSLNWDSAKGRFVLCVEYDVEGL
jgi:hypothetical protein